jgi:hypothetical protein
MLSRKRSNETGSDGIAGFAKADLSDQRLKAAPIFAGRPRLAKIVIDDVNSLAWLAEHGGSLDQPILQLRAFLIDDGPARAMTAGHTHTPAWRDERS